ncbi:hypothetical protein [Acidiphilium acidophilum]|uniref:Uncharacterized protein n=1 Tax=Acidiphilium acidophilum TaxID=76588 RepID=A0AAW9DUA7_ACIAO|nr:hypothetical protein [Acidiphilium acidophilum]MDX5931745.1 hypothetical protein [Acidiphilium acidophilum]
MMEPPFYSFHLVDDYLCAAAFPAVAIDFVLGLQYFALAKRAPGEAQE